MFPRIILLCSIPLLFAFEIENGKQFDSSKYASKGERGENGYLGKHQTEKGVRGHHDKENHRKQYAEEGGRRQGYNHKDGYYGDRNQASKGSKGYHYEDQGKYAKGHNTKGRHNIHKLNEYKKNTDFFDEDKDEAFEERHGGYEASKALARGGYHKAGDFKKGYLEGKFGIAGFGDTGSNYFQNQGHDKVQGLDSYYGDKREFGQKEGSQQFKKFGFSNSKN